MFSTTTTTTPLADWFGLRSTERGMLLSVLK